MAKNDSDEQAMCSETAEQEMRNATPEELEDPAYWEAIYAEESPPGWDIGQPAPALLEFLSHPPKPTPKVGSVAVIGCGYGHDAMLFARYGHKVTAIDYATPAIEATQKNAEKQGFEVHTLQSDIFKLPEELSESFDYVIEHTCFCAIHPTRRSDYAQAVHRILKPGGQLVGIFYNHGREGGPPYDATADDVRKAFESLFDCRSLTLTSHSIEKRQGKELFARFWKRA